MNSIEKMAKGKSQLTIVPLRLVRTSSSILMVSCCLTAASAEELTGVMRVIDGDTIVMGNKRIRLQGIDAPEMT